MASLLEAPTSREAAAPNSGNGAAQPAQREPLVQLETNHRRDLLRIPLVRRILEHRAFQFGLVVVNLFFFMVIILSGLVGTPVGNRNFSIIFVWIIWWALLIMLLVPFAARAWCTMCPIPALGEWAQRGAVIRRRPGRLFSLNLPWPRALRNIWLQNVSFVAVAMFSAIILTRPPVTSFVLLTFIVMALAASLLFQRRVFCRYICPVGGFIGLYAMTAPAEVRVKDPNVCLKHCAAECVRGSAESYGCPWLEYPGSLARNAYCGMCTECIKACPVGNVALNVRPFGTDLLQPVRHLDEAFKGFIMLAAALIYSTVMLGPWGTLKAWANFGSGDVGRFVLYAIGLVGTMLVLTPAIFLAFSWLGKLAARARGVSLRRLFIAFGYTTVPLGLMGWIAFSLSFVFINVSYAIPVISDPFGWGWNLFHTADYPWTPYVPIVLPYLQLPLLLGGLALSIRLGYHVALETLGNVRQARAAVIPITVLLTAITGTFLWLYLG
ncbi:MAG: 4Fe-4S binding protein [Chloroflexota bacterium]|nr:4Fe-4S binding protein [Chloroflexota bacterium]